MVSECKMLANRRNALRSTGPRSEAGKEKVGLNAFQHGIYAERMLLPGESQEELNFFRERMWEYLRPAGPVEELLAERLVAAAWRLRRLLRIETEMLLEDMEKAVKRWQWQSQKGLGMEEEAPTLGGAVARNMREGNTYGKLRRYEYALERSMYGALRELRWEQGEVKKGVKAGRQQGRNIRA